MSRPILILSALTVVMTTPNAFASTTPREATLQSSADEVTYRDEVTLSGQISAPPETPSGCVEGVEVVIRGLWASGPMPPPPPDNWPERGRTTTDAAGRFAFTFEPLSTRSYVAHVMQDSPEGCDADISDAVLVRVRALVKIRVRDRVVDRGDKARFTVRVQPHCRSFEPEVRLDRKRGSRFAAVTRKTPRNQERCVVKFKEPVWRSGRYRGATDALPFQYEASWSPTVKVIIQKP